MRTVEFISLRFAHLVILSSLIGYSNSAFASHGWYISGYLSTYYDNHLSKDEEAFYYGGKLGYQLTPNISSFLGVETSPLSRDMFSLGLQGNVELINNWSLLYSVSGATAQGYGDKMGANGNIMPIVGLGVRYTADKQLYLEATQENIFDSSFSELEGAKINFGVSYYFGRSKADNYTEKFEQEQSENNIIPYSIDEELDLAAVAESKELLNFNLDSFEFDENNLMPHQTAKLSRKFDAIPKSAKIELTGHTDNHGSELYNLDLGLQRAKKVKSKLIELGYSKDNIYVFSCGESKPIVITNSNNGLGQNRRVNVVVIGN